MGQLHSAVAFEKKTRGQIFTPEPIARFLADWAITEPEGRVLDVAAGEGIFLAAAWRRLKEIGARSPQRVLYGVEKDPETLAECRQQLDRLGIAPEHLVQGDFFEIELPSFQAVIGNPPYVRRMFLEERLVTQLGAGTGRRRLTDLYCYFLLRAMDLLLNGGRLAVIVSASWLDMEYGTALKQRLTEDFCIHLLLGFEGQVFPDALVKPVLLLAEKRKPSTGSKTRAALWSANDPVENLPQLQIGKTHLHEIEQQQLDPEAAWSPILKAPEAERVFDGLPLTGLGRVAESRIGLQTFAKSFYILAKDTAERLGLEKQFLAPLAVSPRHFGSRLLRCEHVQHFVFYCSLSKERLQGTQALWYIRNAEERVIPVRGKNHFVKGYANAPRLARAGRDPWYNIRTEIDRRGCWPIFLPRRIFRRYLALANTCSAVANEDFLEIRPYRAKDIDLLLSWLNSSWGEVTLRQVAHLYGGGVFNLNPGRLPSLKVPDFSALPREAKKSMCQAWREFARRPFRHGAEQATRKQLDHVIGIAFGADAVVTLRVQEIAARLRKLSEQALRVHGDEE